MMNLDFSDKSFCFTGKFRDYTREALQKETRARGGLANKGVSESLDFLVVGDLGSTSWKHGEYGNKINKARQLNPKNNSHKRPYLLSESDFIEQLQRSDRVCDGEVHKKILVFGHSLYMSDPMIFDDSPLVSFLKKIFSNRNFSHRIRKKYSYEYLLFDSEDEHYTKYEIRSTKVLSLDDSENDLEALTKQLSLLIKMKSSTYHVNEGTSIYSKLYLDHIDIVKNDGFSVI